MHGVTVITCNNEGYFMLKYSVLIVIGYLEKMFTFRKSTFSILLSTD
jgi:hypothetical protein